MEGIVLGYYQRSMIITYANEILSILNREDWMIMKEQCTLLL